MHCTRHLATGILGAMTLASTSALAADYYVSPTGSDAGAGTEAAPFATWGRAQTAAAAGDTVYFRGGTYTITDATTTCSSTSDTVSSVVLDKSGAAGKLIDYVAYPGERPVFDFSGVTNTSKYNCRHAGVRVEASFVHLRGLELKGVLQLNNLNHESWCVYVTGGSNNLFEQLDAHHNMGPGFFLQKGANNTFLNCDSHENEDTLTSNGDGQSADGFGCHPSAAGNTGNVFHGCRAWWNSDDGWDFINASEACTVEDSWAFLNGYKPDAISNGKPVSLSSGNGNGFKGGGYGMPPSSSMPTNPPVHVVRFNAAFYNKSSGFYANHSPVSPIFYNNTAYDNGTDFNLLGVASDGSTSISVGTLRNNLAFAGTLTESATLTGPISDSYNSWDASMNLKVAASDFQSTAFSLPSSCPAEYAPGGAPCVPASDLTAFAGMASARNADGSLPALPFLRLAANSPLIDKGTDVGLPYAGKAPDLGCFEDGLPYDEADGGAAGGTPGTGGASGSGGSAGSGGSTVAAGSGGSPGSGGGAVSAGGGSSAAGASGLGGNAGSQVPMDAGAGRAGAGVGSGGSSGAAGASAASSTSGAAGTSGTSGHVNPVDGGSGASSASGGAPSSGGCGCTMHKSTPSGQGWLWVLAVLGWVARRRPGSPRGGERQGPTNPESRRGHG